MNYGPHNLQILEDAFGGLGKGVGDYITKRQQDEENRMRNEQVANAYRQRYSKNGVTDPELEQHLAYLGSMNLAPKDYQAAVTPQSHFFGGPQGGYFSANTVGGRKVGDVQQIMAGAPKQDTSTGLGDAVYQLTKDIQDPTERAKMSLKLTAEAMGGKVAATEAAKEPYVEAREKRIAERKALQDAHTEAEKAGEDITGAASEITAAMEAAGGGSQKYRDINRGKYEAARTKYRMAVDRLNKAKAKVDPKWVPVDPEQKLRETGGPETLEQREARIDKEAIDKARAAKSKATSGIYNGARYRISPVA